MIYNKLNLSITSFCGDNKGEKVLSNVLFKKDRTVATDRYVLIEVKNQKKSTRDDYPKIPNTELKEFKKDLLVPAENVKEMLKKLPKNKNMPILKNAIFIKAEKVKDTENSFIAEFNSINKRDNFSTTLIKTTDKIYPEYEQVKKEVLPKTKITINPKYLKKICDFYVKHKQEIMTIDIDDPTKAIMIKDIFNGDQEVTAFVMPMGS